MIIQLAAEPQLEFLPSTLTSIGSVAHAFERPALADNSHVATAPLGQGGIA
ncbi:hypothetical protein [Nocardia nova]|uniref:hypothetical protein n=1 Tax=Nocardia nova TaxID=37330 RepID=UPI0015E45F70|nr:hypothetical protein [Nocardia nova]